MSQNRGNNVLGRGGKGKQQNQASRKRNPEPHKPQKGFSTLLRGVWLKQSTNWCIMQLIPKMTNNLEAPMPSETNPLVGRGVYTLGDAFRLTGIPSRRILRWTRGYTFEYRGHARYSPPIIATGKQTMDGQPFLEFLDLIEVRFLNTFREHGVGWKAIRIAAQRAKELLQRTHPFSTKIFKTDGRTILADFVAETGDQVLLDLVRNQYEFKKVISPYLYGGLEFNRHDEPSRWYPVARKRSVVIDPTRCFGAPIASRSGIPTRILMQTFFTTQSYEMVADWFDADTKSVRDAITYEQGLPN
jgi:uncharacterized protein (DUF433 family)